MQLFYSTASPFARKTVAVAHETGVYDQLEVVNVTVNPTERHEVLSLANPTGKIPTLVLPDGRIFFDSRVICEYFDRQSETIHLLPKHPDSNIAAQTMQALGDAMMDAAVLYRYENSLRPEALRWEDWSKGQLNKITTSLDYLERHCMELLNGPCTIGNIAIGCALGYMDFRNVGGDWRADHPDLKDWFERFSERPSMKASMPS